MEAGARVAERGEVVLAGLLERGLVAEVLDTFAQGTGGGSPQLDAARVDFLRRAIRTRGVDLGGAREPHRIPRAKLKGPYFRTRVEQGGPAAELMCLLWAWARTPLREAAAALLAERGYAVFDLGHDHLHPVPWAREALAALAEDLAARVPETRVDQAALMLFLLAEAADANCSEEVAPKHTGAAAVESAAAASGGAVEATAVLEDTGGDVRALSTPRFRAWAEELANLAPEAAEWDELAAFVAECQRLVDIKRREAEAQALQRREAEEQALLAPLRASLVRLGTPAIALGLDVVPHLKARVAWGVEGFEAGDVAQAASSVERLANVLEELGRVSALPPPRTAQDIHSWSMRIGALQEEAEALIDAVSGLMRDGPRPEDGGGIRPAASDTGREASAGKALPAVVDDPSLLQEPLPIVANPEVHHTAPHTVIQASATLVSQREAVPVPSPPTSLAEEPGPTLALRLDAQPESAPFTKAGLPTETETSVAPPATEAPPVTPVAAKDARAALALMSRREAAQDLLEDGDLRQETAFLLALVAEGDYAGAHWLARAQEARNEVPPLPSWLLAAAAGSVHLAADTSALGAGLLQLGSANEVPAAPAARLLATAVALRTALEAPHVGLTDWLDDEKLPHGLGSVNEVVRAGRAFALAGVALPEDVRAVLESRAERAERIAAAAQDARRWLESAPLRSTNYHAATLVWVELATGKLAELLNVVVRDARGEAENLPPQLQQWMNRDYVEREVQAMHERRIGPKARQLVGAALKKIFLLVEEACERAMRWYELVTLEQKLRGGGDWLTRQVVEVRARVERSLPAARASIEDWRAEAPAADAAAAAALSRSLTWVGVRLGCAQPGEALPADVVQHVARVDARRSLRSVVAQRLATLPALQLSEEEEEWDAALGAVGELLAREVLDGRGVRGAVEGWIERGDFRFAREMCDSAPDGEREELAARVDAARAQRRAELRSRLVAVRADVERAHVEGIIGDERSELLSRLESINPEEVSAFGPALQVLDGVLRTLAQYRAQGLEVHRKRWSALQPQLPTVLPDEALRAAVTRRVEEVLKAADIRSADELVTHLSDVAEENAPFNAPLFEMPPPDASLEGFVAAVQRFEGALKSLRGRDVPRHLQELQPSAPAAARRELASAHGAWLLLTQARSSRQRLPEHLEVVLRYVGFAPEGGARQVFSPLNPDGLTPIFRVALSAGGASPLPQFGSRAEGRYRVACVWEREGVNTLDPALAQLPQTGEPTLVVYLGRLSLAQRRSARAQARRSNLEVLVLDEWLLLYLESYEALQRLGAFFRCTLPWAPVNPYVQRAGTVPPEMFFGRTEMVRALAALDGPSIVYGGRQLGKSALLEHVQRSFHAPSEGRYAVRLDIKTVGDPGADKPPVEVWARLRDALKTMRFLSAQVTTEIPERLRERILEQLGGEEKRQLLILLDEADNFLDADARHAFEQVTGLRDLMNHSAGRCKVVFAGLHNVQRFQAIGNQPLAHFGLAHRVGPLEPREAVRLITDPLTALGFRFKDGDLNAAILHILSYTNYHPGLIQLFCRNLVQLMQTRADAAGGPPYLVREADVREVYSSNELRQLIRDCFVWTIALDPRYEATVLSLVAEQMDGGGDYARAFSAGGVLEQAAYWWRAGFANVQTDRMRGLLDEMVGLGVLVTNSRNEYRLRSPNVVRLLGTRDDITNRLLEMGRMAAPPEFDADHHHALFPDGKLRFSPLTYAQERQLLEQRAGVTLLFGNAAMHVGDVGEALAQLARQRKGKKALTAFAEAPASLNNSSEFEQWLKETAGRQRESHRLLVVHALPPAAARSGKIVDVADALCAESTRGKGPLVRVIFTLEPLAGWAWLSEAVLRRPEREDVPWLALKRWTPQGVRRLLDMADMAWGDEALLERVCQRTTGGWHVLLNSLVQDHPRQEARRAADVFEACVAKGGAGAQALWRALGLAELPLAGPILRVLGADGELVQGLGDVAELLPEGSAGDAAGVATTVEFLVRYGCVEWQGGRPTLAPLVAAALP